MKNRGILRLAVSFVVFVAGLILLSRGIIGVLLMVAGIGGMIFASVTLMAASGKVKANYFDNGRTFASDQASEKVPLEEGTKNMWDQMEQKRD